MFADCVQFFVASAIFWWRDFVPPRKATVMVPPTGHRAAFVMMNCGLGTPAFRSRVSTFKFWAAARLRYFRGNVSMIETFKGAATGRGAGAGAFGAASVFEWARNGIENTKSVCKRRICPFCWKSMGEGVPTTKLND